jgi:hypothetical protein
MHTHTYIPMNGILLLDLGSNESNVGKNDGMRWCPEVIKVCRHFLAQEVAYKNDAMKEHSLVVVVTRHAWVRISVIETKTRSCPTCPTTFLLL